jgi:hypothetical protein
LANRSKQVLLHEVAGTFDELIGRFGCHAVASGGEMYIQPYVYLSLHLVQMRAAGWAVDFDQVAAVSGASALFAYQRDDFMPKYAHLDVEPDRRIAEATGFGYEWVSFEDVGGAWERVIESIDAGRSAKGWDWEGILFAGYRHARRAEDRKVFALADGPGTYARWLTWDEFGEWAGRVGKWGVPHLGRHTGHVGVRPAREVALRLMRDLVAWSTDPPASVRERYPEATLGLAGIEAYAAACERADLGEDWLMCHPINGQWGVRNASSVYLRRVAESGILAEAASDQLCAAADAYRAAYEHWATAYREHLGHDVPEERRKTAAARQSAASEFRSALADERTALAAVAEALSLAGG